MAAASELSFSAKVWIELRQAVQFLARPSRQIYFRSSCTLLYAAHRSLRSACDAQARDQGSWTFGASAARGKSLSLRGTS